MTQEATPRGLRLTLNLCLGTSGILFYLLLGPGPQLLEGGTLDSSPCKLLSLWSPWATCCGPQKPTCPCAGRREGLPYYFFFLLREDAPTCPHRVQAESRGGGFVLGCGRAAGAPVHQGGGAWGRVASRSPLVWPPRGAAQFALPSRSKQVPFRQLSGPRRLNGAQVD